MSRPDLAPYGIDSLWLTERQRARRLLFCYAHPDDESFGNAGTIARYVADGAAVHYVCATRGECGVVDEEHLNGYASIADLRTAELTTAARALRMDSVHFLGYRDSGMAGSEDNQHPQALINAPREQAIGQIVAAIRATQPQVVVTFNEYGGYGHPDHIYMNQVTCEAFHAAGDPARYPEQLAAGLEPWQAEKLYYSTFSAVPIKVAILVMRLMRKNPRAIGRNADIDMVRVAEEVSPITTKIPCGAFLEQQEQAWQAHRSQLGGAPRLSRLPTFLRRVLNGSEAFYRVVPAWTGGPRERDLFEGLR